LHGVLSSRLPSGEILTLPCGGSSRPDTPRRHGYAAAQLHRVSPTLFVRLVRLA
jgi:hypothetical protein